MIAMLRAAAATLALCFVALTPRLAGQAAPDSLRELFRLHLAASVRESREGTDHLGAARSAALAYAAAVHDSTLIRQLARFARWSPADRAVKVTADSLRHAGFELFPREGAAAALLPWRAGLRLARSIDDSAGIAATAGNIGAAFLVESEADSASWYLDLSRRVAQELDDFRTLGNALGALGSLEKSRNDYRAARVVYQRALAVRLRSADDRGAAADENNLGLITGMLGDTAGARRFFESALARNRTARRSGPAATNLVNLANLDIGAGRNAAAAGRYREALALHRAAGEQGAAGLDLRGLGGIALRVGDYAAAIAHLTDAVRRLDAAGSRADAVGARAEMAEALAAAGEIGRAASVTDSAAAMLGDDEPSLSAAIAMLRGDLASDVGAADDASLAYARADSLFDLAGDALGRAAARQGAGMLLLRGDDPAGAARALRAAAQVQRDAGELRAAALTDVLIGVADGERGSAAAARVGLRRARTILRRMGDAIGEAAALNALGDIEQRAGRTIEAERQYRAGLRALGTRAAPAVATSLHWSLGRALRARHALAGSARELRLAVAAMEGMAGRLPPGDRRTSLLGSASDLYADLALVQHAQGRDGAAFETSEWLRARQMREGMAERDGPRSDLSPVTPAAVSASLAPGEALLEYLVADSATLLFVVTRDTVRAVTLPAGRDALRAAVEFARAAIARGPARSVREPWAPAMRRLRRLLIEPAESTGLLRDASRLLVAPHAELQYLPFAALMRAGSVRYLVEQYEIAYVPSAAIWLALQQRTPPPGTSVLAMAPFPASLPGSGDEARAIGARYGPRAVTLTGAAATQQAFERALPGRSIVHLATYGVLNRRNPAYSFVAFAPSANDDGRLTVSEVLRLSFRARLVVLSACETALGSGPAADVPAGDDWVGLVRAFLLAGADDVMASLWPVEDRPTSRIVRLVYSGLERGDAAAALAAAQRVALRDRATSAPRHWAALVVVGAARGKS